MIVMNKLVDSKGNHSSVKQTLAPKNFYYNNHNNNNNNNNNNNHNNNNSKKKKLRQ